jgi:hypothetical protein
MISRVSARNCLTVDELIVTVHDTIADLAPELQIWLIRLLFIFADDAIDDLHHHLYRHVWLTIVPFGPRWDDTKKQLKRILWIDPFHDELERNVFNEPMRKILLVSSS